MQKNEIDLLALAKAIWVDKKKIVLYAIIGTVAGVVMAVSLPRKYTSSMLVVSENKSSSRSSNMGALASMMGASINSQSESSIKDEIYPYILKSTPFVSEFVDIPVDFEGQTIRFSDYLLFNQKLPWWSYIISAPKKIIKWVFSDKDIDLTKIDILQDPELFDVYRVLFTSIVSLEIDDKDKVISISTTTQSPTISKQINDSVYVKLESYLYDYKTAKARQNLDKSEKSLAEARENYYKTHEEYAQMQDRNRNLIQEMARIRIQRLENENNIAFSSYQQLATQVEMDKIKLQEETPIATIIQPSIVPLVPSSMSRVIIILLFGLLGIIVSVGVIIFRYIIL